MQLSPTVRWIIGAVSVAVAAFAALLGSDVIASQFPDWVAWIIAVLTPTLNFLLAPPQLGGTQQGLANPTLTQPPPTDTGTAPSARGETTFGTGPGHLALSPAVLLAADRVSEDEALFWIGVLIVVGCLVAAAVVAYRFRDWLVPLVLVGVAIVAAILLL